jgi:hypothetical protein
LPRENIPQEQLRTHHSTLNRSRLDAQLLGISLVVATQQRC